MAQDRRPWAPVIGPVRRELARRRPRLLLRLSGLLLFRFAARAFLALLFQEPPRFTRFEPVVSPDPGLDIRPASAGMQECRRGPREQRHFAIH